jgi:hypothetical protein
MVGFQPCRLINSPPSPASGWMVELLGSWVGRASWWLFLIQLALDRLVVGVSFIFLILAQIR